MNLSNSVVSILKDQLTKKENLLQKIVGFLDSHNGRIQDYSVDILFKRTSADYETHSTGRMSEPVDAVICFTKIPSCTIVIYVNWKNQGMRKYSIMNIEADKNSTFCIN